MNKGFFALDERGSQLVRQISTILYYLTLLALIGIQLYRQFVLQQPTEEWNDIAILIAFNAIVWIGLLLYLSGVVNPGTVKVRHLIIGFAVFVAVGLAFTIFKYAVLLGQPLGSGEIWDIFLTVFLVSAGLTCLWGILAFLGSRRIEKKIS